MDVTCAVLIVNEHNEMFLAHSTGNHFYDLPKGVRDPDETSLSAAVRECKEETSIVIDPNLLEDLGERKYNSAKNLHLFRVNVKKDDIDMSSLVCESMFEDRFGRKRPEADGFMWVEISKENIEKNCTKSMIKLLLKYFNF